MTSSDIRASRQTALSGKQLCVGLNRRSQTIFTNDNIYQIIGE